MKTFFFTQFILLFVISSNQATAQKDKNKKSKKEIENDEMVLPVPDDESFIMTTPIWNDPTRIEVINIFPKNKPEQISSITGNSNYKTTYLNNDYHIFYDPIQKNKEGISDKDGNVILPNLFDISVNSYIINPTNIIVSTNQTFGVFDLLKKNWAIPMIYDEITPVLNRELPKEAFIVSKNGKKAMMNVDGEVLIPFEWEAIHSLKKLSDHAYC